MQKQDLESMEIAFNKMTPKAQVEFILGLEDKKDFKIILDNDETYIKHKDDRKGNHALRMKEFLGNSDGVILLLRALGFKAELC